jgi:hypothetical protein
MGFAVAGRTVFAGVVVDTVVRVANSGAAAVGTGAGSVTLATNSGAAGAGRRSAGSCSKRAAADRVRV